MSGEFQGKVVIVTGGGSGIGRAAALAFARERAKVVIADIDSKMGEETVKLVKDAGSDATFVKTDVSKAAQVQAMVDHAVRTFGRLDYAFNNAGVLPSHKSIVDCTEEEWDRITGICLKGVWLCMKYEIPQILKQKKGAIVNTSSSMGVVGAATRSEYCASKHGVLGMTKAVALEYSKEGIRVNAVCPHNILTPPVLDYVKIHPEVKTWLENVPVGRAGTPEDIAQTAVWLCSDAASFITGQAVVVDGGFVIQ